MPFPRLDGILSVEIEVSTMARAYHVLHTQEVRLSIDKFQGEPLLLRELFRSLNFSVVETHRLLYCCGGASFLRVNVIKDNHQKALFSPFDTYPLLYYSISKHMGFSRSFSCRMTRSPETATTPASAATTTMEEQKRAAFATPDRDHGAATVQKDPPSFPPSAPVNKTVTPPTPNNNGKQVRFDKDNHDIASNNRGLVSRRGGRYGSPSRGTAGAVVEYKTYRSPKREETSLDGGVPSLWSSNSGTLREAPSIISCSEGETTSPLGEDSPSKKLKAESRNVTFSPRPTEVSTAEKVSLRNLDGSVFLLQVPHIFSLSRQVRKHRHGHPWAIIFTTCRLSEMPNSVRHAVSFYHPVHPHLRRTLLFQASPRLALKKRSHPKPRVRSENEPWRHRRTLL